VALADESTAGQDIDVLVTTPARVRARHVDAEIPPE
jgi:hypothetical protein